MVLEYLLQVSQVFRSPSQREIFSKITLCDREGEGEEARSTRLGSLRALLTLNPILLTYIRTIHIMRLPPHQSCFAHLWVEPALACLLKDLLAAPLQHLRLSSQWWESSLDWAEFSLPLKDVLIQVFSKPSLRVLSLENCVFPQSFFHHLHLPGLEQIDWVEPSIRTEAVPLPTARVPGTGQPCLANLQLSYGVYVSRDANDEPDFEVQNSGLDLSALRCLYFKIETDSLKPSLPRIPQFERIEELNIEVIDKFDSDDDDVTSWCIDLSRYTKLRKLSLRHVYPDGLDTFAIWIGNSLQTIPSFHPTLQSISVGLDFKPPTEDWDAFKPLSHQLLRLTQESKGVLKPSSVVVDLRTTAFHVSQEELMRCLNSSWEGETEKMVIDVTYSAAS
ncbi:hypothetical protein BDN72DRAFT_846222 [Pluteus cervinus]|uniref:Uncharacterized protein n=1 Tax=Pluteus cervinus TaxID=181527 RepID=A0ACD3AGH9_9AGAR|nr:hypothetical protein BDN72DRAFT_846222 [Pluteus cervinus]